MAEASLQKVMQDGLACYSASHRLSPHQWQVCHHLLDCRTEALGGLRLDCDHCGQTRSHYYACRDRHCPRCQRRASEDWCERQRAAVLPVTYHHLVATLPHDLNPRVQRHPEVIYALLFESVWATLSAFGADPKRLGGQLGMSARPYGASAERCAAIREAAPHDFIGHGAGGNSRHFGHRWVDEAISANCRCPFDCAQDRAPNAPCEVTQLGGWLNFVRPTQAPAITRSNVTAPFGRGSRPFTSPESLRLPASARGDAQPAAVRQSACICAILCG